jgi:hypothetical protein
LHPDPFRGRIGLIDPHFGSISRAHRVQASVVEATMKNDLNRVIVAQSDSSSAFLVHHRDFPEIRAEGASPREAASHLVNKLACALDSALTDWRRENVDHAIADVKAFVAEKEDVPARDH